MKRIVLFGGTSEGRGIAELFADTDVEVYVCVATEYGETLLPNADNIKVYAKRMNEEEMTEFLNCHKPELCVDATHPYATEVTANIQNACKKSDIPYKRIEREAGQYTDEGNAGLILVDSVHEAAEYLRQTKGNILITTGSKELDEYTVIDDYKTRCFARVLPTGEVMKKCHALGFEGKNLIGMQGPFDEEMNYLMLRRVHAEYMVTKNSGTEGGYEEKCRAARRAGATIIVIRRPNAICKEMKK